MNSYKVMFGYCCEFRADEEPVDPKKLLEESCKPKCVRPLLEYQVCGFYYYLEE
jgi:hypothetical protein